MAFCYNCGIEVSRKSGTETKEHIPAQNLFAGFGDEFKKNRIVVPSCLPCNRLSSQVDEEFRNVIGTISNSTTLDAISRNTAKAIVTTNKQYNRLRLDTAGNVRAVNFNKGMLLDNHLKIFKGLFYHQYKKPIPVNYKVLATIDPDDRTGSCLRYLLDNFEWSYSGHPDIFSYVLQPFREGLVNIARIPLVPIPDEPYFISLQKYNNSHAAVVIATNQEIRRPN